MRVLLQLNKFKTKVIFIDFLSQFSSVRIVGLKFVNYKSWNIKEMLLIMKFITIGFIVSVTAYNSGTHKTDWQKLALDI